MNGALIVDKPAGLTSHDVVARVRHLLQERRVGHTGTLDPFATGVLVLLIGRATRLAQFLSGLQKEYEAVIRLGFATDTGDITGKPLINAEALSADVAGSKVKFGKAEIEAALAGLRGDIDQVPPMYSAKKQQGRKLYELARRGEEVERQPVRVTIQRFETNRAKGALLKDNLDGTYDLDVLVACSAGTYVRTLAEDFGKRLGIGAHVAELRRTRAGAFKIEDANTLEQLGDLAESGLLEKLFISPDATLAHLPALDLSADDVRRVMNGSDLQVEQTVWPNRQAVRLRDESGELTAVGIYDESQKLVHPQVVLAN